MSKMDLINEALEELEQSGEDLNNTSSGGGDFEPAAPGPTRVRLVSYIETGVHTKKSGKYIKTKPRVELGFELSGPKHEPKVLDDGTKIPFRINIGLVKGTHVKNGYIKLFKQLVAATGKPEGSIKNFVQLMMKEAWLAKVSHWKTPDGQRTIVQLTDNQVFTFKSVQFEDEETGELRKIAVAPAISEPRLFLWDSPTLAQWDSLYIEGQRDDGTSKNFLQERIRQAENFEGSPIQLLLLENDRADEAVPLARNSRPEGEEAPEGDEGEAQPEAASLTEGATEVKKPAAAPAKAAKPVPAKAPVKNSPAKAPGKAQETRKPAAKAQVADDDSDPLAGV